MDWMPIETAPRHRWLKVSMRDVNREPPVWRAQRRAFYRYGARGEKPVVRWYWIARDGLICNPTHWAAISSNGKTEAV
jgi:hypothetical protein